MSDDSLFAFEEPSEPSSGIHPIPVADDALHRGARRQHNRWMLNASVRIEGNPAMALNASAGGLRVASARAFPHGRELDVHVRVEHTTHRCRARVVWSRKQGGAYLAGLAFAEPDPRFRDASSLQWARSA